jgi:hypothetical protein
MSLLGGYAACASPWEGQRCPLWYFLHGQHHRAAKISILPWYTHKVGVTFSDMLATL